MQTDLEALILESTTRAQTMSELAHKAMEGLKQVETDCQAVGRQLASEVSQTRGALASALSLLDALQTELERRDQELHQELTGLESESAVTERAVTAAADPLLKSNQAAIDDADQQAKLMATQIANCQARLNELRTSADSNVDKLGGYYQVFKGVLARLSVDADAVVTALEAAQAQLLREHSELDKALAGQIERLESSYAQMIEASDKRLNLLEGQLSKLQLSSDTHLDQEMVRKLAADLRKASDSFAIELGQVEKDVRQIATTVSNAQGTFGQVLVTKLQPNVVSINFSLYNVARNLNFVS